MNYFLINRDLINNINIIFKIYNLKNVLFYIEIIKDIFRVKFH